MPSLDSGVIIVKTLIDSLASYSIFQPDLLCLCFGVSFSVRFELHLLFLDHHVTKKMCSTGQTAERSTGLDLYNV